VIAHDVALLVVIGHAPYAELARSFVATSGAITRFVKEHQPPFIAKVYRPPKPHTDRNPQAAGRIELWFPRDEER
jgi:hypothetical protein